MRVFCFGVVLNVVSEEFTPLAALRRTFGPVSATPGSARAFLAQDSLCSALSRDIRCAQSGIESLNATHLEISECTRSAFRAPPPLMCFTDENNKETEWMASYRAPKTRHSTQPQLLLSASLSLSLPLSSSAPSFRSSAVFQWDMRVVFFKRNACPPVQKEKGFGLW